MVTADDFGLAVEVNEAVELAHRQGILTSASLMVGGGAAADAIRRACTMPALRVGLHLVLVDGAPTLPPEQIPDLVDGAGHLRRDLVRLAIEIASSSAIRSQMRAEITAQFEAYAKTRLVLDHVDVHKHFHLHPIVAREVVGVGRLFGMGALRVPDEPMDLSGFDKKGLRGGFAFLGCRQAAVLKPWTGLLRARARRAALRVADAVFGLTWSGRFTTERMTSVLRNLPSGLIEIYLHPGIADRFPGCAAGYRYADELRALVSPAVIAAALESGFRLGGYCDAPAENPR